LGEWFPVVPPDYPLEVTREVRMFNYVVEMIAKKL